MEERNKQFAGWLLVVLVIALGVGLRAARIDDYSMWVDEAESSINGLTILTHGVPVDNYLGLPIYENVMQRPWPESEEYEFKDLSYSDRGVAVYHGWLPLYSIALSEWIFGVTPDHPQDKPQVLHDEASIRRRTWAPRVPSLVYSALFLTMLFVTARDMGGDAAGWAALVFAALGKKFIWFGCQARYYSATLALDALCAWSLWRCIRHGRRRDFAILAGSLVLLFHTHTLSCVAVATTTALVLPLMRGHSQLLSKLCLAAGIFLVGTVPWAWFSGLIGHAANIPPARDLLVWPDDILQFVVERPEAGLLLLASLGVLCWVFWRNRQLGWFEHDEVAAWKQATILVLVWLTVSYALFFFAMPAASFFWERMTMTLETPALLLVAIGLSVASQIWSRSFAPVVTATVMLVFLLATGRLVEFNAPKSKSFDSILQVVDELRQQDFRDDTKFYCSPNFHLVYTYYTGLPVQSVAPIREPFLNRYPGPIVFLMPYLLLNGTDMEAHVREAARNADRDFGPKQIQAWKSLINRRVFYEQMQSRVDSIAPEPKVPNFLLPALEASRQLFQADQSPAWVTAECPLMFRSFTVVTYEQWWVHYFYRFVDPDSRLENKANFSQRLQTAHMKLLPRGNSVSYAPPLIPSPAAPSSDPPH